MRARTNVILAEKIDSHLHYTWNVVVAKISYRMIGLIGILSFSYRERALPPSTENKRTNFYGGKKNLNEGFRGVYLLQNR